MKVVDLCLWERVSASVRGLAQQYVESGEGSVGATGPCRAWAISLDGEGLKEGSVCW